MEEKRFVFPFSDMYGRFLDHYNYENSNEAIIDNWWKQFDEFYTKRMSEYLGEKKKKSSNNCKFELTQVIKGHVNTYFQISYVKY